MIAYVDMFSGISGDMALGALVDLGVPLDWIKEKIAAMPLDGFDIRVEDVWRNGIRASNLFVDAEIDAPARDWSGIRKLIQDSSLPGRARDNALLAFETIARAESTIHGTPIDRVHFHEVGGIDALVDIVGTFLCVDYLGIDKVVASPVALGTGFVSCSHGLLPLPAPATLEILTGVPVVRTDVGHETVTPTGAAIITTLAESFDGMPAMVMEQIGYGSGKRQSKNGPPNLLRIMLGKKMAGNKGISRESLMVVETTLDDMNPEIIGYLMDKLFETGALDVCLIPVHMKKNRPGTRIEALCRESDLDAVLGVVFLQSTTTGVRYYRTERAFIHRAPIDVNTRYGSVRAKALTGVGGEVRLAPEFEVCRKIAEEHKVPLRDVYEQLCLDMAQHRL